MDVNCWSPKFLLQNEKDCLKELSEQWDKVPLLNVNNIQDVTNNKLVRFRGMIQDMYNPEYYFEKYEVINEVTKETSIKYGKYLDIADCKDNEIIDMESENNVTQERQTLVVISVPALNNWVEEIESECFKIQSPKRNAEASTSKRKLEENETEMETETTDQPSTSGTSPDSNKKQCTQPSLPNANNRAVVSQEHLLNFPLENRTGKACHMKIYDEADKFKLNDMYEFVGFLSVDPVLGMINTQDEENQFENQMELQTHNPSPALIPRIHCVSWKKLNHNNPLVQTLDMSPEKIQDTRKEVMIILTELLLGDEIAAEYLLYHLISRVYLRQESMALGKFSLNLSKIPIDRISNYSEKVYEFIEMLIPKSHYFPMTLNNMNTITFIPKKDYECNRLTSGLFQLSEKTHLVLDETKLSSGKLNEAGVKAIQAMSNIISAQKVAYDFNYYQMEYDSDIPFLVLSEGKSLLPCDSHVPVKPAEICLESHEELFDSLKTYLIKDRLNDIRKYLTQTCLAEYEICDNVEKVIQDDFVELRQKKNITAEDLHNLLVLARLICLSEGKQKLSEECWKKACKLEKERKARIPKP